MTEELPVRYKRIDPVIESLEESGLVKRVAKLKPVGIIVER